MELIAKSGDRVERISIERLPGNDGPGRYRIEIGERVHDVEARSPIR